MREYRLVDDRFTAGPRTRVTKVLILVEAQTFKVWWGVLDRKPSHRIKSMTHRCYYTQDLCNNCWNVRGKVKLYGSTLLVFFFRWLLTFLGAEQKNSQKLTNLFVVSRANTQCIRGFRSISFNFHFTDTNRAKGNTCMWVSVDKKTRKVEVPR